MKKKLTERQKEIIEKYINFYNTQGILPSLSSFTQMGISRSSIRHNFGGMSALQSLMGSQFRSKLNREASPVRDVPKSINHGEAVDQTQYNRILVLSDMHHPFAHPDIFKFLKALKKKYNFDKIVGIGDEVDYHALSFHDSDPDLESAGTELKLAVNAMKALYKIFPEVDLVESNHGSMVYRKGLHAGIPRAALRSYNETLQAPSGWKWKFDFILETKLGPVYFCHGKSATAGRLASQYGMSTVQGHFHEKAQIHYISTPERLLFDMHVGCLADDKSLALGYNKINVKRPIVSVGIIIDGIPQIIPMVLNRSGRWVGGL